MNYYGKKQSELTKVEQTLLTKDIMYFTSVGMKLRGERLIGMGLNMGTEEDVSDREIDRNIFVGKFILGIRVPKTQKSYDRLCERIESTKWGLIKFLKDHTAPKMVQASVV